MREDANIILAEIGQSWLTDSEWEFFTRQDTSTDALFYKALADVLNQRTATGDAIQKLKAHAVLNDVEVLFSKVVNNNIFIGSPL